MEQAMSEEFFAAIGKVAVASSHLEFVLGCLYSSLLGDEERHSAVAFGPGVQQTITACNALIDLMRNESLAARGKEALRRAGALAERRNAVVHGIWATESKSRRMSLQMRYWGKRDVTHWSQEDLEALVEELNDAAQVIREFDAAVSASTEGYLTRPEWMAKRRARKQPPKTKP